MAYWEDGGAAGGGENNKDLYKHKIRETFAHDHWWTPGLPPFFEWFDHDLCQASYLEMLGHDLCRTLDLQPPVRRSWLNLGFSISPLWSPLKKKAVNWRSDHCIDYHEKWWSGSLNLAFDIGRG